LGTHRTRPPEETWEWIQPVLPLAGITRVADVTSLDCLGLPVYQAVRPASLNLSVSQGKAMTRTAAMVSAVMESVELWHSEKLDHLPQATVSIREMQYANLIGIDDLKWVNQTRLLKAMPLAWLKAQSMSQDRHAWIPRRMVELNLTLPEVLEPQMFHRTSNGLASGNCREEALLHSLCELVERHSLYLFFNNPFRRRVIDQDSLRGTYCWSLVERIREADMKLVLRDVTWEVGVPCVIADMVAPDLPNVWRGSGCHTAPEVAISRALNEAAQSRLTYISGARDDLTAFSDHVEPASRYESYVEEAPDLALDRMPQMSTGNVQRDLDRILEALDAFDYEAFWMDFSRDEVGVPVTSVFVPGLREAPYG